MINTYYKIGSDGFIALKGVFGTDQTIEQAARVSYGVGTRKVSETRGLIRYLMRHAHASPLEMAEMSFHIRLPIYVCRQWHRHRTWNYNEYSGRYSEMIDSMEISQDWRKQSKVNKQGSEEGSIHWPEHADMDEYYVGSMEQMSSEEYLSFREKEHQQISRELYEERIKFGVAREQARKDLPVSNYTEMFAKADLRNILGFITLRCDHHAQIEIRQYANMIACAVREHFPILFEVWYDYSFCSYNFTRLDQILIKEIFLNHGYENPSGFNKEHLEYHGGNRYKEIGMDKREFAEFVDKFTKSKEQEFILPSEVLPEKESL